MTTERNVYTCEPHRQSECEPHGQIFTVFGERLASFRSLSTINYPLSIEQRYTYIGRESSAVSGDYHFRYRTYGAAIGGFLIRDTLGYVDGMSQYAGCFAMGMDSKGTKWCAKKGIWNDNHTIACDGHGKLKVKFATGRRLKAYIKECIKLHEECHIKDALEENPDVCKCADGTNVNGGVLVINDDVYGALRKSEIKCYKVEIDCLEKIKRGGYEKKYKGNKEHQTEVINERIKIVKESLDNARGNRTLITGDGSHHTKKKNEKFRFMKNRHKRKPKDYKPKIKC